MVFFWWFERLFFFVIMESAALRKTFRMVGRWHNAENVEAEAYIAKSELIAAKSSAGKKYTTMQ